ncbi:MAG TPA: hypothetical protein VFH17_03790 [Coriobacteriia bacterium]|nr:hypothetical protein [Coriobacteriia bacterium]
MKFSYRRASDNLRTVKSEEIEIDTLEELLTFLQERRRVNNRTVEGIILNGDETDGWSLMLYDGFIE